MAGVFQADGKCTLTTSDTVTLNGEIIQENLNFNYQVSPDCTGSASSDPGQEAAHFNFAIITGGARVIGIHSDPGTALILKAKQQFDRKAGEESEQ